MKKIVSLILVLACLFVFCSCGNKGEVKTQKTKNAAVANTNKQDAGNAEEIAETYLQLFFKGKFAEVEKQLMFSTDEIMVEGSKLYPNDVTYDENGIEIDGQHFDSVEMLISAAEEKFTTISLSKLQQVGYKKVSEGSFREVIGENEFAQLFINTLEKDVLDTIVSVEYEVEISDGEDTYQGVIAVWLAQKDGKWRVISPTWVGTYLLGYQIFK